MNLFNRNPKWRKSYSLILWFVVFHGIVIVPASPPVNAAVSAQAAIYVDIYGVVDPQSDRNYLRVENIFRALKRVSGLESSGAELIIVASNTKPWAIALADGNVVLSAGAVDIIYSTGNPDTSDAWMAFVLGHEIAHLKNADLWHHKVHSALVASLAENPDSSLQSVRKKLFQSSSDPNRIKSLELKADEQGFLYASLAGYDTSRLFRGDASGDAGSDLAERDFLNYWVEQTGAQSDLTHHSASDRTRFLKARLNSMSNHIDLFEYSYRLAHFSKYEDALVLLREFQSHFPSYSVLNNLGYIYLQKARQKMPVNLAYRFWFPTLLEADSGLPEFDSSLLIPRSIEPAISPAVKRDLEQAVLLLSDSVKIRNTDLAARVNLVAAYWYLNKMFKARASVEEALEQWPENSQLLALRALILLEQEPGVDMWPRSKEILETLLANGRKDGNIVFNLARILSERGRHGDAQRYWKQLLQETPGLPYQYRLLACRELNEDDNCVTDANTHRQQLQQLPVELPVEIGADIDDENNRGVLLSWNRLSRKIGALQVDIFTHANGDSVLALDYTIEMVASRQSQWSTQQQLEEFAGVPHSVLPASDGSVWSFDQRWSVLVKDESVVELWIAR